MIFQDFQFPKLIEILQIGWNKKFFFPKNCILQRNLVIVLKNILIKLWLQIWLNLHSPYIECLRPKKDIINFRCRMFLKNFFFMDNMNMDNTSTFRSLLICFSLNCDKTTNHEFRDVHMARHWHKCWRGCIPKYLLQ